MKRKAKAPDPRWEAWRAGLSILYAHAMFRYDGGVGWAVLPLLEQDRGYARVDTNGTITCNGHATLDPMEWAWVVAHAQLHRGLGHLAPERRRDAAARAADCLEVNRFLRESKVGREPIPLPDELPRGDVTVLAERWRTEGIPEALRQAGVAGYGQDVIEAAPVADPTDWPAAFAIAIARGAAEAVEAAGGEVWTNGTQGARSVWDRARRWFLSSYPLLGGLASQFTIVADAEIARRQEISIAAVHAGVGEIYINPLLDLSEEEWRFVLAHEMLHAALRHGDRIGGRDPYLWNIATDFVINGWLVEMQVGEMPEGLLYDASLAGLSAEAVYDLITTDLRRLRKLATLRGRGRGDILDEPLTPTGPCVDLDEYYRRALATGLSYHESSGRGWLPSGLVEEIRALDHPPLPWDARLARWFAEYVRSPEPRRSYARASRRQASTPDIPRPGWRRPEESVPQCTFGVVLDTSGSMDRQLLGMALGAIASYAIARDVPKARVVFCDAAAYDAGYLAVEDIAGRVKVRGRGGTILQPGVSLLERAGDFPADAPILVITDADCDVVRIRREHAFLIPQGARLPFAPHGPVFPMTPRP